GEARRAVVGPDDPVAERGRIRLVVHPQALLLLHGLALVLEVLRRDRERAHPVGLEPQRQIEPVRRHRLVVARVTVVGRPVQRPGEERQEPQGPHSGEGMTGPECTSANENVPSRVSPLTTRRGATRVAYSRSPPVRSGSTSNRPAGTSMVVGCSATKLSVASESPNSLYARTASESPGAAFVTAAASNA